MNTNLREVLLKNFMDEGNKLIDPFKGEFYMIDMVFNLMIFISGWFLGWAFFNTLIYPSNADRSIVKLKLFVWTLFWAGIFGKIVM